MAPALKGNKTVTKIPLCSEQIGDAEALKNTCVADMDLNHNQMVMLEQRLLQKPSRETKPVTKIHLDGNHIGAAGVQALAEAHKVDRD